MRYGVIGTGAVGGYLGIKLMHAGYDVHFLARSDFAVIKEKGLMLYSVRGDVYLPEVPVYSSSSAMPPCDVLLVCTKTTANAQLPSVLAPLLASHPLVIMIQNGIGMEEDLAGALPHAKIAGGAAYIAVTKTAPACIRHLDIGKLSLAPFSENTGHELIPVADELTKADVKTTLLPRLDEIRWRKLVWNIPFNGLSVVLNTTTEGILRNEKWRSRAWTLMQEVVEAARACGTAIEKEYAGKMMEMTQKMPSYATSMKDDYDNHRPLEIEYMYQRPASFARRAGFIMHETEVLTRELLEADRLNRKYR